MPRLTARMWSATIERWNATKRREQQALAAVCRARGHDWAIAPIDERFCRRCCAYGGATAPGRRVA